MGVCLAQSQSLRSCYLLLLEIWSFIMCLVTKLYPTLCDPTDWNFLGKNAGVGCLFLLQRVFSTQGSNLQLLHLLHRRLDYLPVSNLENPIYYNDIKK